MANSVIHRRCYSLLFDGVKRAEDQTDIRDAINAAVKKGSAGEHIKVFYDQCYGEKILVKEFDISTENASSND